jgi:hypothetical protein
MKIKWCRKKICSWNKMKLRRTSSKPTRKLTKKMLRPRSRIRMSRRTKPMVRTKKWMVNKRVSILLT